MWLKKFLRYFYRYRQYYASVERMIVHFFKYLSTLEICVGPTCARRDGLSTVILYWLSYLSITEFYIQSVLNTKRWTPGLSLPGSKPRVVFRYFLWMAGLSIIQGTFLNFQPTKHSSHAYSVKTILVLLTNHNVKNKIAVITFRKYYLLSTTVNLLS